jgi:hypothetical protein
MKIEEQTLNQEQTAQLGIAAVSCKQKKTD